MPSNRVLIGMEEFTPEQFVALMVRIVGLIEDILQSVHVFVALLLC